MKTIFITSSGDKYLGAYIEQAAKIHNHCIALHRRYYKLTGKYLSAMGIARLLREACTQKHIHKRLGHQPLQEAA